MSIRTVFSVSLTIIFLLTENMHAQAAPTATERLQVSAFATGTTIYTEIYSNRNYGITTGIDLGVHKYFNINPSLEIRSTYPFLGGAIRAKNLLGGLKFSCSIGNVTPYIDVLFGRGQINYGSGVPDYLGTTAYVQTPSNVFSPGVGADFRLTDQMSLKVDGQLQRYSTPVLASGHVYIKSGSIGLAYRFDFNRHLRWR